MLTYILYMYFYIISTCIFIMFTYNFIMFTCFTYIFPLVFSYKLAYNLIIQFLRVDNEKYMCCYSEGWGRKNHYKC